MFKDLNYLPLDVESNIYGMTKLEFEDKTSKILVSTLDCRLYCISYNKFKPHTREVEFTYIPNGAKIISIGALKRAPNDFVIGITHSLSPNITKGAGTAAARVELAGDVSHANRQTTYYFNIYASESAVASNNFDLDHVAQGCQTIRLRFVPYHLLSTELLGYDRNESPAGITRKPIWLLSGGDNFIHAYAEDRPYQSFNECPIEECFPELCDKQKSIALWMDVVNIEHSPDYENSDKLERAVALGFEDGAVKLYQSVMSRQTLKWKLVRCSTFDTYATIIPCVRLFRINSMDLKNSKLRKSLKTRRGGEGNLICDNEREESHLNQLNLLAVSSTEWSLVFRNILQNGLEDQFRLPESQRLDSVTTAAIGDTNADGFNEIILGSHGKELITYQYDISNQSYRLENVDILNYPIFSMSALDITGDGLKDVTILLTSGILIKQAAIKDIMELCRQRVGTVLLCLEATNSRNLQ